MIVSGKWIKVEPGALGDTQGDEGRGKGRNANFPGVDNKYLRGGKTISARKAESDSEGCLS
jgi:hypothetical protein